MVKKFSYLCDFAGKKHPVTFYIGDAAKGNHPESTTIPLEIVPMPAPWGNGCHRQGNSM